MVLQMFPGFKPLFFQSTKYSTFQERYDKILKDAFSHKGNVFQLPCSGAKVKIGGMRRMPGDSGHIEHDMVKNGFYRRNVVDAEVIRGTGRNVEFRFHTEKGVKIQVVKADSGHNHSMQFGMLVPYEKFSIGAALAILYMCVKQKLDAKGFCQLHIANLEGVTETDIHHLLEWAHSHFGDLGLGIGTMFMYSPLWYQAVLEGMRKIIRDFKAYHVRCTEVFRLAMFQRRKPVFSPHLTGVPYRDKGLSQ